MFFTRWTHLDYLGIQPEEGATKISVGSSNNTTPSWAGSIKESGAVASVFARTNELGIFRDELEQSRNLLQEPGLELEQEVEQDRNEMERCWWIDCEW